MVKTLSNKDICLYVYKHYDILKLIHKLIHNSYSTNVDKDLLQYIYITIMTMNNEKLNKMFHENKLRNYICKIIVNQRNSNRYLNKYIRSSNLEYREALPEYEIEQHDFRIDFLYHELERYNWFTGHTQQELRKMYGYELLILYINGSTKLKIMLQFNISLSTLNVLLKEAKNNLRKAYDNGFNSFIDDVNLEFLGYIDS